MSRYVFITYGSEEPTQQVMDAWMAWFAEIADSVVDRGAPLGPGREVTPTGARDLPTGADAATGYTVVEAESMEAAEKLLEHCPIITSVRVYEAMQMEG
jgi:hypothetical protein